MEVQELAPGLWRWTAPHPDWEHDPEPGSPADWPREVGCVYYEAPDAIVLIDPLVPVERATFLEALDRDVDRLGLPVAILLTVSWHERSAGELAERYGAEVWSGGTTTDVVTKTFAPGGVLPGGLVGIDAQRANETLYWLPEQRALVPGDVIVGDEDGGLHLCPESWLRDTTQAEFRLVLGGLLELPVELVLVSHGEPVLEGGHTALAAALAG